MKRITQGVENISKGYDVENMHVLGIASPPPVPISLHSNVCLSSDASPFSFLVNNDCLLSECHINQFDIEPTLRPCCVPGGLEKKGDLNLHIL